MECAEVTFSMDPTCFKAGYLAGAKSAARRANSYQRLNLEAVGVDPEVVETIRPDADVAVRGVRVTGSEEDSKEKTDARVTKAPKLCDIA